MDWRTKPDALPAASEAEIVSPLAQPRASNEKRVGTKGVLNESHRVLNDKGAGWWQVIRMRVEKELTNHGSAQILEQLVQPLEALAALPNAADVSEVLLDLKQFVSVDLVSYLLAKGAEAALSRLGQEKPAWI